MAQYVTLSVAIDRINKAINNLESDIKEWSVAKSNLFNRKHKISADRKETQLKKELDTFIFRTQKVRDNLIMFRSLFDNISVN
jgi:predicted  nucleic acid-binding Zn-ribbon protein